MRLGRYELIERIGVGGMAEVFLARAEGPAGFEKTVVLKRMHAHLMATPDLVKMFLDEARVAARFRHPNLVSVFDFGEAGGAYFLAMEYLEGADLHRLVRRAYEVGRPTPASVVALVGAAACEGLDHVHRAAGDDGRPLEVVHRDVSLANVFVTREGEVKILDFGVARVAGASVHTRAGMVKGKYPYMSPEQARGEALDGRSDLFSLGIVLHELATGAPLFHRPEGDLAILGALLEAPIPSPRALRPDLPEALEAVILRALERDPARRWSSAREMGDALEAVVPALTSSRPSTVLRGWIGDLGGVEALAAPRSPVADEGPGPAGPEAPAEGPRVHDTRRDLPAAGPGADAASATRSEARGLGRVVVPLVAFVAAAGLGVGGLMLRDRLGAEEPTPYVAEADGAATAPGEPGDDEAAFEEEAAATHGRAPLAGEARRPGQPRPAGGEEAEPRPARSVPAKPAATRGARLDPGTLVVACKGGWSVRVDGRVVGEAPLDALALEAGSHRVEVRSPDGKERGARDVLVAPNRVRVVDFGGGRRPPDFLGKTGMEEW